MEEIFFQSGAITVTPSRIRIKAPLRPEVSIFIRNVASAEIARGGRKVKVRTNDGGEMAFFAGRGDAQPLLEAINRAISERG